MMIKEGSKLGYLILGGGYINKLIFPSKIDLYILFEDESYQLKQP